MPAQCKVTGKKRSALDTTSSCPEGDHRKRRRNRTTQSCLNCHTSKRMCDRKRPCGRCTQLGLTGLCVYEIDDPSQRSSAQDESSHLRERVAELEGVIHELKNKPHPRWMPSSSTVSEECEKRALSHPQPTNSQTESSLRSDTTEQETSESNQESSARERPFQQDDVVFAGGAYLEGIALNSDLASPLSSPPLLTMTAVDRYIQPHAAVSGDYQRSGDLDLASIFTSYPGLVGCDASLRTLDGLCYDSGISKPNNAARISEDDCGCLNDAANYTAVLELSLWLRKATDVLSHSSNHRAGTTTCALSQRIRDLDRVVIATLTRTTKIPNQQAQSSLWHTSPSANTSAHSSAPSSFPVTNGLLDLLPSTISSQSSHGLRDIVSTLPSSFPAVTDSFMSWERSRP